MRSWRRAVAPATTGSVQVGGSVALSVGPNRDAIESRLLTESSLTIAADANAAPVISSSTMPRIAPARNRRRRSAASPSRRRARPMPANTHVAPRASSHGYAASPDGSSVCGPRPVSCVTRPASDGTSRSTAPIPSHTIPAKARSPRAIGG